MLLDKPAPVLDPERVEEVFHTVFGPAEDGMIMLRVTHEMGSARSVADRVIFTAEGRIVDQAPQQAFDSRGTRRPAVSSDRS